MNGNLITKKVTFYTTEATANILSALLEINGITELTII